jgi:glyoxalase family protein
MGLIHGNHHLTFCVGPAQEDWNFHTGTLGLRFIKKTALYDGELPVYHLYYGNGEGDPGTILTSFPYHIQGVKGKRGNNQISRMNLSVPMGSIGFWADRLKSAGIKTAEVSAFGSERLLFDHPCGLRYGLVADGEGDASRSWEKGGVSADHAILGTHGIEVSVMFPEEMQIYLTKGLEATVEGQEDQTTRYALGTGRGRYVELKHEPDLAPGTWFFGEGSMHHAAWDIGDSESQLKIKGWLEGLGYTDVTEVKDRGYFMSVYNRTPAGALFEYAWSKPESWGIDESWDELGMHMQVPPVFADKTDYMLEYLAGDPLETEAAVVG